MSIRKFLGFIIGCGASIVWFTTCLDLTGPDYFDDNGDTLILKFGETKISQSSGLRLTFSEVLEDSRCPSNVVCDWEGRARIQVGIQKKSQEDADISLPIYGYVTANDSMRHVAVDTLGYSLKLLQLDPYPVDPVEPDYRSYEAAIFIKSIGEM